MGECVLKSESPSDRRNRADVERGRDELPLLGQEVLLQRRGS